MFAVLGRAGLTTADNLQYLAEVTAAGGGGGRGGDGPGDDPPDAPATSGDATASAGNAAGAAAADGEFIGPRLPGEAKRRCSEGDVGGPGESARLWKLRSPLDSWPAKVEGWPNFDL